MLGGFCIRGKGLYELPSMLAYQTRILDMDFEKGHTILPL